MLLHHYRVHLFGQTQESAPTCCHLSHRHGPYVKLNIDFCGRRTVIGMHRAVWAWHYGRFPDRQLDHINDNPTDNRIENLREVSGSENMLNMLHDWRPNRDTGLPGVSPNGNRQYKTRMHGKFFHFHDPFEAFFHATLCGKLYKG